MLRRERHANAEVAGRRRHQTGLPVQARSSRISRRVPTTEIAIDPRQPNLFEKKRNIDVESRIPTPPAARPPARFSWPTAPAASTPPLLSLIHISEPTRLLSI